jgi:hypothetical protein
VPYRQVERDAAADAESEDVRLRHPQMLQQADDVGGQVGAGKWPVDVIGAPVSLEVGGDHLSTCGQARQELTELQVDIEQTAVQQK